MGDIGNDSEAAIALIIEYHKRLERLDSHHELLKYVRNVTDDGYDWVRENYLEFLDRFESPEDKNLPHVKMAKVKAAYATALMNAADELERTASRSTV